MTDTKSFSRKKNRKTKKAYVKFELDGQEFETVVDKLPTGAALSFIAIDDSSTMAEQARVTLDFFRVVLGDEQYRRFMNVINDDAFEADPTLLTEISKFILSEFAGRSL